MPGAARCLLELKNLAAILVVARLSKLVVLIYRIQKAVTYLEVLVIGVDIDTGCPGGLAGPAKTSTAELNIKITVITTAANLFFIIQLLLL